MEPINVVLLGGGKGGTALIELFTSCAGVKIVGVADTNPNAPGLQQARLLNIPTSTDAASLIAKGGADLIVDVTGDPAMAALIAARKPPGVESLSGNAARLVWSLIQDEQELREHLVHTEKLATLGTLAASVAHEVNNPLHWILGFAQLIQEEKKPAVIKEYAQEIVESVEHLSEIAKSLTMYSQASYQGEPVRIDIAALLDNAVKMAKFATVLDEVEVVREYTAVPEVQADPGDLIQAFVTLLVNGAQAMKGRGRLTLATLVKGGAITVSIHDTGPWIPSEHREKLFAPFSATKPGGTGMGLYVVRSLIQKHGGWIVVESEEGRGTTFSIQFPKSDSP
ncbi:MAG: two-component system sensor histidine kinase NtrB [Nitrospiraceae bacterium]